MTSSAIASSLSGASSPSALAALRLITSPNLVGCWTGRSAGWAPLRMRLTYEAARRKISDVSVHRTSGHHPWRTAEIEKLLAVGNARPS